MLYPNLSGRCSFSVPLQQGIAPTSQLGGLQLCVVVYRHLKRTDTFEERRELLQSHSFTEIIHPETEDVDMQRSEELF